MQANENFQVFIVDPDTAIRDSVELLLESNQVAVHGYRDGSTFLSALVPATHGCLLVESSLPDSSGLALISTVRRLGIDIPALLLTSSTDPGLASRAAEMGVSGIVRKPLHSRQLIDQIEFLRYGTKLRQSKH